MNDAERLALKDVSINCLRIKEEIHKKRIAHLERALTLCDREFCDLVRQHGGSVEEGIAYWLEQTKE